MKIKTKIIIEMDLEESINIKRDVADLFIEDVDDIGHDIEMFDTKLYQNIKKIRNMCNDYLE